MKTTIEIDVHPHHAIEFDSSNPNWSPQKEYNYAFLRAAASYLQQRLDTRGHLFVNEVREQLGLEPTPAGQVCGWIRRDGYVAITASERPSGNGNIWVTFTDQGIIVNNI